MCTAKVPTAQTFPPRRAPAKRHTRGCIEVVGGADGSPRCHNVLMCMNAYICHPMSSDSATTGSSSERFLKNASPKQQAPMAAEDVHMQFKRGQPLKFCAPSFLGYLCSVVLPRFVAINFLCNNRKFGLPRLLRMMNVCVHKSCQNSSHRVQAALDGATPFLSLAGLLFAGIKPPTTAGIRYH